MNEKGAVTITIAVASIDDTFIDRVLASLSTADVSFPLPLHVLAQVRFMYPRNNIQSECDVPIEMMHSTVLRGDDDILI